MIRCAKVLGRLTILMATTSGWAGTVLAVQPLGQVSSLKGSQFVGWEDLRSTLAEAPKAEGRRPVILGVSGRNFELLQDAMARKAPLKTKGSLVVARKLLAQAKERNIPMLRGQMAEAMFLDRNPEYRYVNKPNASQYDVYRPNPTGGRGTIRGQVKFHMKADYALYSRDMAKDWRANNFFVPDDHAAGLRSYLLKRAERLETQGNAEAARQKLEQARRVKSAGYTTSDLDRSTRQAVKEAKLVRVTPLIGLGIATALALGPTLINWAEGGRSNANNIYYFGKSGSIVATGLLADQGLRMFKGGLLRGTLRGNALVAAVVIVTDTSWSVYEHGGIIEAFQTPSFMLHLSGSLSATGCAFVGGYAGGVAGATLGGYVGTVAGPKGMALGATVGGVLGGVVIGGGAGMAAYVWGHEGSRWVLKSLAPEYLYREESRMIQQVIQTFEDKILSLQMT